jgi:iron complex outermembrane receptor protein
VRVSFVNQNAVVADGYDFSANLHQGFDLGRMDLTLRGTYLNKYETTLNGVKRDISGYRNFENFARSLPKWRANLIGSVTTGPHTFTATINYISSYKENFTAASNVLNGFRNPSFTTLDLQYGLALEPWGADLTLGVTNVTNKYPPVSQITSDLQGFDRFLYDPRGAVGYVRMSKRF